MRAQLLVLASGAAGSAAVDLSSGSLLRTYWVEPPAAPFATFDVVDVDLRPAEEMPFPADTVVAGVVAHHGHLRGRRVARVLKPLVHPTSRPLLGGAGPSVPYWTLPSSHPTLALIAPSAGPVVERDPKSRLQCRFRWGRLDHVLPLDDPVADDRLSHPTATHLAGGTLARALGWRPRWLVVTLLPPVSGLCHKVVAGMLPKP